MKYFVKYKEWVYRGFGNSTPVDKIKFFTTTDIEAEWDRFKSKCDNEMVLVDITELREQDDD